MTLLQECAVGSANAFGREVRLKKVQELVSRNIALPDELKRESVALESPHAKARGMGPLAEVLSPVSIGFDDGECFDVTEPRCCVVSNDKKIVVQASTAFVCGEVLLKLILEGEEGRDALREFASEFLKHVDPKNEDVVACGQISLICAVCCKRCSSSQSQTLRRPLLPRIPRPTTTS